MARKLVCKQCGHEQEEGIMVCNAVTFDMGFTWVCCECRGDMDVIEYEAGRHLTECDKVLQIHERRRL